MNGADPATPALTLVPREPPPGLSGLGRPADGKDMERSRSCDASRATGAEWIEGYAAATNDAVQLIELMGGDAFSNLSSPVLMHLKARLSELRAKERQGVA